MSTLNRAIKRHLKSIVQTGANLLSHLETAIDALPNGPEKADVKAKAALFHEWAAGAVENDLGLTIERGTVSESGNPEAIAFVGTPKDNDPKPGNPGG